jgi:hypothetical protein
MWEYILYFVITFLVMSLVQIICSNIWLTFKWNVLGFPPRILNEKLVDETVEKAAVLQFDYDIAQMERLGVVFTEEAKAQFRKERKAFLKSVIEQYIDTFSRRG